MEWKSELPDGSYPILDIPDYYKYIIKKHETVADNPPIRISVNQKKKELHLKLKQDII